MSLPVVYLREAVEDIEHGYAVYEACRPGLGARFLRAVNARIDGVSVNPELYAVFRRGVRATPLKNFPYILYYRARGADVLVVAVQHGRRSQRGWRDRI